MSRELYDLVRENLTRFKERPVFLLQHHHHPQELITYGQVDREVLQCREWLVRHLMQEGEQRRVGVLVGETSRAVLLYLVLGSLGHVLVPLEKEWQEDFREGYLDAIGCEMLLIGDCAKFKKDQKQSTRYTLLDQYDGNVYCRMHLKLYKRHLYPTKTDQITIPLNDLAYVVQTSGTSSMGMWRKPVFVGASSIIPNIIDFAAIIKRSLWSDHENANLQCCRTMMLAPLTFDPSFVEIYTTLFLGGCLIIPDCSIKSRPQALLRCIREGNANVLMMTPSFWNLLTDPQSERELLHCKRPMCLFLGGESFPIRLTKNLPLDHGKMFIYNVYGTTELSCWAFIQQVCHPEDATKLGSPLTGTNYRLIPTEKGKDYFRLELGSKARRCWSEKIQVDRDDMWWHDTGDLVICHPSQQLEYVGRGDWRVKRFGQMIDLRQIERLLMREITDFLFVHCLLEPTNFLVAIIGASQVHMEHIKTIILARFGSVAHLPDWIELWKDSPLPINENGKLDLVRINNAHQKGLLPILPLHATNSSIIDNIPHHLQMLLGWECELNEQDRFGMLGGTSFQAVYFCDRLVREMMLGQRNESLFNLLLRTLLNEPIGTLMTLIKEQDANIAIAGSQDDDSVLSDAQLQTILSSLPIRQVAMKGDFWLDTRQHPPRSSRPAQSFSLSPCIELLWRVNMGRCVDAPPLLVRFQGAQDKLVTVVYIGSHSRLLLAIDPLANSAGYLWGAILSDRIEDRAALLAGRLLCACRDGRVYAFEPLQGKLLWCNTSAKDAVRGGGFYYEQERDLLWFASHDGHLYGVQMTTGDLSIRLKVGEPPRGKPIFLADGIILLATLRGSLVRLERMGMIRERLQLASAIFADMVALNEHTILVMTVNGHLHMIDPETFHLLDQLIIPNAHIYANGAIIDSAMGEEGIVTLVVGLGKAGLGLVRINLHQSKFSLEEIVHLDETINCTPIVIKLAESLYEIYVISVQGRLFQIRLDDSARVIFSQKILQKECFSSPIAIELSDAIRICFGARDEHVHFWQVPKRSLL